MYSISSGRVALVLGVCAMGMGFTACDDEPDKYKHTDGVPYVEFVRSTDPAAADSLLTGAFLSNTVCLRGSNLLSIHEIWFNDQQATLNTSLITDNSLIVDIPSKIPAVVTDKMYLITWGNDTVAYPFKSLVPAPKASSMSCEWAPAGSLATIYGDYFVNDPSFAMTITDVDGNQAEIKTLEQNKITFIVPENWEPGYLSLTSIYGKGRSKFRYKDTMNILFDFDGSHGGHESGHGWRNGVVHTPGTEGDLAAIDGSYLYFGGTDLSGEVGATWAEDQFSFNYWPEPSAGYEELKSRPEFARLINSYGIDGLQIKFEIAVPSSSPWKSCAMQMVFSPSSFVTYANANNSYLSDKTLPRGLWLPWKSTGSYDTADEWATASMPLSAFSSNHEGGNAGATIGQGDLDGLTFFVWNGGIEGQDCAPVILIDNIRVVPIE